MHNSIVTVYIADIVIENKKRRSSRSGHYRVMQRACSSLRCTLHRASPTSSRSLRLVLRLSGEKKKKPSSALRFRKIRQPSVRKVERSFDSKNRNFEREKGGGEITLTFFSDWLNGANSGARGGMRKGQFTLTCIAKKLRATSHIWHRFWHNCMWPQREESRRKSPDKGARMNSTYARYRQWLPIAK